MNKLMIGFAALLAIVFNHWCDSSQKSWISNIWCICMLIGLFGVTMSIAWDYCGLH